MNAVQSRSRTRMLCKQVPIALRRPSLYYHGVLCTYRIVNSIMKLLWSWVAIRGTRKGRFNFYMLILIAHQRIHQPQSIPCNGFSSLWSPHPAAVPELYPLLALLALEWSGVDLVSAYFVLQLLHCVGGDAPVVVTNVTIHLKRAGRQVHQARCVYRVKFPGQRLFL